MLRNITVKQKVYFLAFMGVLYGTFVSLQSIIAIEAVGVKLVQIAEEDIPLTNKVSEITIHQLEQAVMLERAGKYAETMAHNASHIMQKRYEESKSTFWKYAKMVDAEILEAEAMAEEILIAEADSQYIVDEFTMVLNKLKGIEKAHKVFDEHAEELFALYESGDLYNAEKLALTIEEEEDKLDKELEALLKELERFTQEAALAAEHLEIDLFNQLLITAIVGPIAFLLLGQFIVRGIVTPLLNTKNYADAISNGQLDIAQPIHNFKDEIADMMASLSIFKDNAIEKKRLAKAQEEAEARAEEEKKAAMYQLADSFQNRVQGIINTVASAATEMSLTAANMTNMVETSSLQVTDAASSADQTNSNVQSVAAAAEEMSSTVREISTQTSKSTALVGDSVQAVDTADNYAQALSNASSKVQEVIALISDIASQINLLALNATIESARAGEAGKGFAVVANEVKNLASETDKSVQEIETIIQEMSQASSDIVGALEHIKESIGSMSEVSNSVASAIEEQSATTNEIASSMQAASDGTAIISNNLKDVTASAQQSQEASKEVLAAAEELSTQAESLDREVQEFLHEIRES